MGRVPPYHVIPPWRWTRYGSDDLELGGKAAAREAVERERAERGVDGTAEERVGDDPADRGGDHEAVAAEAGGHPEAGFGPGADIGWESGVES